MKKIKIIVGLVVIIAVALFAASFFTKRPAGKLGDKVDQTIEEIKDSSGKSLKKAGDKIKETAKDVKRKVSD
jgi:hypothetical protein